MLQRTLPLCFWGSLSSGFAKGFSSGGGGRSSSSSSSSSSSWFGGGSGIGGPFGGLLDKALEWCSTSHAYTIAREQGITLRDLRFETTPDGGVNVLVDAPNATPLQIEQLGKRVQEECPVARFRKTQVRTPQQEMKWLRLPESKDSDMLYRSAFGLASYYPASMYKRVCSDGDDENAAATAAAARVQTACVQQQPQTARVRRGVRVVSPPAHEAVPACAATRSLSTPPLLRRAATMCTTSPSPASTTATARRRAVCADAACVHSRASIVAFLCMQREVRRQRAALQAQEATLLELHDCVASLQQQHAAQQRRRLRQRQLLQRALNSSVTTATPPQTTTTAAATAALRNSVDKDADDTAEHDKVHVLQQQVHALQQQLHDVQHAHAATQPSAFVQPQQVHCAVQTTCVVAAQTDACVQCSSVSMCDAAVTASCHWRCGSGDGDKSGNNDDDVGVHVAVCDTMHDDNDNSSEAADKGADVAHAGRRVCAASAAAPPPPPSSLPLAQLLRQHEEDKRVECADDDDDVRACEVANAARTRGSSSHYKDTSHDAHSDAAAAALPTLHDHTAVLLAVQRRCRELVRALLDKERQLACVAAERTRYRALCAMQHLPSARDVCAT